MKWTIDQVRYLSQQFQKSGVEKSEAVLAAKTILEYVEKPGQITRRQLLFLVHQQYPISDIIGWTSWQAWVETKAIKEDEERKKSLKAAAK